MPQEWPAGPVNLFARFIGPSPVTSVNPRVSLPQVHPSAFVSPFAVLIGDVRVGPNVFIAPNTTLRADEGTPFFVGENTNLQDGVILHGLRDAFVTVHGQPFSIYIDAGVTCAHGALVHGPCFLGRGAFIGFKALVYNAVLGEGVFVGNAAVVTDGVRIAPQRFVPPNAVVDTQERADALRPVPASREEFAREVQQVNREFPAAYSLLFGPVRCSCGLACAGARG